MPDERVRIIVEFEGKDAERKAKAFSKSLGDVNKEGKATSTTFKDSAANLKTLAAKLSAAGAAAYTLKKAFDFAQEGAALERLADAGDRLALTCHGCR